MEAYKFRQRAKQIEYFPGERERERERARGSTQCVFYGKTYMVSNYVRVLKAANKQVSKQPSSELASCELPNRWLRCSRLIWPFLSRKNYEEEKLLLFFFGCLFYLKASSWHVNPHYTSKLRAKTCRSFNVKGPSEAMLVFSPRKHKEFSLVSKCPLSRALE